MTAREMGRPASTGETTRTENPPKENPLSVPRRTPIPIDPAAAAELAADPRWADKVTEGPDGCQLWTGSRTLGGYGTVRLDGRHVLAHRVALVAYLGRDLAPGMQAGHACHDEAHAAGACAATRTEPCHHRLCVNAAAGHLAEQDTRTNSLAGGTIAAAAAARTHCPAGHELAGDNLVPDQLGRGKRNCLACNRAHAREQYRAIGAAARALGMTQRQYGAAYGWATATALEVLDALGVPRLDQPAPTPTQLAMWDAS